MKSKIFNKAVFIIISYFMTSCASYKSVSKGTIINENIEWSSTWIVNTNDKVLPKVLLIGDSHVERYYGLVAKYLDPNKVSCSKFTTSKSLGDPLFIKQLESVLSLCTYDVVSINNGLHGADYKIEEYAKFVPIANKLLAKNVKKSLIWVNTTAIREAENVIKFAERNHQVIERNKFLTDFTKANNLMMVDFYSSTANKLEYYTNDGVHFNQGGVEEEATLITKKINQILNLK